MLHVVNIIILCDSHCELQGKGRKLQKLVIKWVYLTVIRLLYGIQQKYLFILLKENYNTPSMFHFKDWTKQPLVVPIDLKHSVICVATS